MDSNIKNYSCFSCRDFLCQKYPVTDLNMAIKNNSYLVSPFNLQIKPVEIEDTLMFFCEPQERSLFSEPVCSVTFTGKASDIINIIKNIEVN